MQEVRRLGPLCKAFRGMTPQRLLMQLPARQPMGRPQTLWVSSMQMVRGCCPTWPLQWFEVKASPDACSTIVVLAK